MAQIKISSDVKKLRRNLDKSLKRRVPNITKNALNATAYQTAKKRYPGGIERTLDRPTPFTKRGLQYRRADIRTQTAAVEFTPEVWAYMQRMVNGGIYRGRLGKGVFIPSKKHQNKYGNLSRRKQQAWINHPKHFNIKRNNRRMVFRRKGKHQLEYLGVILPKISYRTLFDYRGMVDRAVREVYVQQWNRQVQRELNKINAR